MSYGPYGDRADYRTRLLIREGFSGRAHNSVMLHRNKCIMAGFALVCVSLCRLAGAQTAPTTVGDVIVATFEDDVPSATSAQGLSINESRADPAEGQRFLTLKPTTDEAGKAVLRLRLPRGASPVGRQHLSAALRAPAPAPAPAPAAAAAAAAAAAEIELRWLALDVKAQAIFQRRFTLKPGEAWVRLDEPLRTWRWDNRRVGDWDEVTEIALVIGSPGVERIDLDDVRFAGHATEDQRVAWLLDLAFRDRPRALASGDGMLVATDATEAFADADLQRLLSDMRRARAFVRRAFGPAIRPTEEHHAPVALLIFKDATQYPAFFERLGEQWRATIGAPGSQGYTIQDVAASTYDPKLGTRRPVYLHEAVHAIVARDLRLLSGHPPHTPLQEGIANYVQLCLFPESIDPLTYPRNFARPIDPSGRGFFKPLETLFARRATTKEYAQLASVVAYLLERDPPLLGDLARGLADGQAASDVLANRETTWKELEANWLQWGRGHFEEGVKPGTPVFNLPEEFR